MFRVLAAATLVSIWALSSPAHATVIDVEDIGQVDQALSLENLSPYQGLNWNATMFTVDLAGSRFWSGTGPAHSGRHAILNNFGGSGIVTGASGAFTFNDLWIKSWFGGGDGQLGTIAGTLGGSQVFSIDFTQSSVWQNIVAGAAVIDTLTITTAAVFLIDDIQIDSAIINVPAPGTLALLGIGLLGLRLRRGTA